MLALGSEDRTITISNIEGDTLQQTQLRLDPSEIQFSEMKSDERSNMGENTVRGLFLLFVCVLFICVLVCGLLHERPHIINT